jgi:hypothetical protein
VRRLVQQHWKMIGWTKKASKRLFTDSDSILIEQLNIIFTLTWQIIVMNLIQLEFMATLTVSLGEVHIRIKNHVCAEWELKVIKLSLANISKSSMWQIAQKQYPFESVCQFIEPLLCHGRATTMLSYYALCYYAEPLALAEWIVLTIWHTFFAFSIWFSGS